jgi:hypothetical protein
VEGHELAVLQGSVRSLRALRSSVTEAPSWRPKACAHSPSSTSSAISWICCPSRSRSDDRHQGTSATLCSSQRSIRTATAARRRSSPGERSRCLP